MRKTGRKRKWTTGTVARPGSILIESPASAGLLIGMTITHTNAFTHRAGNSSRGRYVMLLYSTLRRGKNDFKVVSSSSGRELGPVQILAPGRTAHTYSPVVAMPAVVMKDRARIGTTVVGKRRSNNATIAIAVVSR